MSRRWMLVFLATFTLLSVLPLVAQDTAEGSVTVSDQLVLNGLLTVESATVPQAGWLVIHATVDGQLGPTVGIAALQAGENQNVQVVLDTLGATPQLMAMLHTDTGTTGMYEYDMMPDVDPPVMQGDAPLTVPFNITALTVFPQQFAGDQVVVGSVVAAQDTWVVIQADENQAAGAVLGSTLVPAGTHTPVLVPVTGAADAQTLWASLATDAGTAGTFEFEGDGGADVALTVNDNVARAPIAISAEPVVITALGAPIESDQLPALAVSNQDAMGDGTTSTLIVDQVVAPVIGWVEVHADSMGHPGKPLGMTNVPQGETAGVNVVLNAQMVPAVPPMTLPPAVWPMLHIDDSVAGTYEYLMVPGADVPVVYNGAVVTLMVTIGSGDAMGGDAMATAEAGDMGGMDMGADTMATAEAGDMGGDTGDAMATEEAAG